MQNERNLLWGNSLKKRFILVRRSQMLIKFKCYELEFLEFSLLSKCALASCCRLMHSCLEAA